MIVHDFLTPKLHFLDEDVDISQGVLKSITTNDETKKVLPRILGKIGRDDLQRKASHYILYQARGEMTVLNYSFQ